jgi:hypothetical protein
MSVGLTGWNTVGPPADYSGVEGGTITVYYELAEISDGSAILTASFDDTPVYMGPGLGIDGYYDDGVWTYQVLTAIVGANNGGSVDEATFTGGPITGYLIDGEPVSGYPVVQLAISSDFTGSGGTGTYGGLVTLGSDVGPTPGALLGVGVIGLDAQAETFIGTLAPGTPVWIGCTFGTAGVTGSSTVALGSGMGIAPFSIMGATGWEQLGTAINPVKIRQADGTWRTFDGSGSSPLSIRQSDGSWLEVSSST